MDHTKVRLIQYINQIDGDKNLLSYEHP